MSRKDGHLRVSGTRIEVFWVYESERHLFRYSWPLYNPSLYGSAPPVSTRITFGSPDGSSLPSFRLTITRVSA